MQYIGLISDTHNSFDEAVMSFLEPVDQIWHAGDFGSIGTADDIAQFKPLLGVYGNCDSKEVRIVHPYIQNFECEGMRILMMHIGGYPGRYDLKALQLIEAHRPDIFICGHSHILRVMNDKKRNMLVINPGAAGKEGFHTVRTALRFRIDDKKISDMEVWEFNRK